RSASAPVKLPRSCPKSSESIRPGGTAPQFTRRNGPAARPERVWIARATTSLPDPVSPSTSTGTSSGATRPTPSITDASPAAEPEAGGSDAGEADRERLRQIEQQVEILKRKLEVQEEDAAQRASRTATAGAGPDGFFLKSPDGKFSIKLRGYAQFDSRWLTD